MDVIQSIPLFDEVVFDFLSFDITMNIVIVVTL